MNLSGLLALTNQIPAYRHLLNVLRGGNGDRPAPLELLNAARPYLLAALHTDLNRPVIAVVARNDQARQVFQQLRDWSPTPERVLLFPEPDALPYERIPWSRDTLHRRIMALTALSASAPPLIVASARALMQPSLPPRELRLRMRTYRLGQRISLEKTLDRWIGSGYEPASVIQEPGTFSRRGGIVDVFSPQMRYPVRIELFGDEIDSLRTFDPATQRSLDRAAEFTVIPAAEALPRFGPNAAERLAALEVSNLHAPAAAEYRSDCESLSTASWFKGIEFYLPYLYSHQASLLDHLPLDALLVLDDLVDLEGTVEDLEAQAVSLRRDLIAAGEISPDFTLPYHTWDKLRDQMADHPPLVLGYDEWSKTSDDEAAGPDSLRDAFRPGPRYAGQLKRVVEDWRIMHQGGHRIVAVSRQAPRLADLWAERDVPLPPVEAVTDVPGPGGLVIVQGTLGEGWVLRWAKDSGVSPVEPPEVSFVEPSELYLLTDAELFGWARPQPRRRPRPRAVTAEDYFADMQPGDYVVHIEHGIGIFGGLTELEIEGAAREYFQVDYQASDKLYVPIHHADRLGRYVGATDRPPRINRLGTADWARVKARTKRAVKEIARDLLTLYSARQVVPGHAFPSDDPWQADLEAAFPYVETEDQLRAIQEVKADMEKPRPMDRLICGDVGYGKTEVALRAAFKAVMGGKQVAVLVPTTVLAQQHYHTFSRRLNPFPVDVEMLSRFRTDREQRDILRRLSAGTLDIVIGTHRLLSGDVVPKDLGLLIIDEEQRFGVTHKEKLKQMRTEVDVLTLTATPIPRTLYMSLTGVRDMSTIDTPPEERLAIKTHVGTWDDTLMRQAVLRELDRGGQVYFVHNRVQTIHIAANKLARLVPEATYAIGHGQMRESDLERVMLDFADGQIDVLVSTTIIESGLDIPNVNTLVVDQADHFGLAQLYQLRGRVGRGGARAYAYFFYRPGGRLTETARQRLQTIFEATELGAGFGIAMRDLEIRGAGDILGRRQHGHIGAVGFDLYTRLLAQAVRELKGEADPHVLPADSAYLTPLREAMQISLPIPVSLPPDYVGDADLRLRLYRRMAGFTRMSQVDELQAELIDRFGPLPPPGLNLIFQLRLKVLGTAAGVQSLSTDNQGRLVLRIDQLEKRNRAALQSRLRSIVGGAIVGRSQVWLPIAGDGEAWRGKLIEALRALGPE
jgi:transcription-repair coupling factor (superfamily II helicase)